MANETLTKDQKQMIRRTMRYRLADLPLAEAAARSAQIQERLEKLPEIQSASTVMIYASLPQEVHTFELIQTLLSQGKRVGLPACVGEEIIPRQIKRLSELRPGEWKILEPPETAPVIDPAEFGVVIVPAVACDRAGHRLGRGAGYYDRFLPLTNGLRVVPLFDFQLLEEGEELPLQPHDVPVDCIVTENATLRFGRS